MGPVRQLLPATTWICQLETPKDMHPFGSPHFRSSHHAGSHVVASQFITFGYATICYITFHYDTIRYDTTHWFVNFFWHTTISIPLVLVVFIVVLFVDFNAKASVFGIVISPLRCRRSSVGIVVGIIHAHVAALRPTSPASPLVKTGCSNRQGIIWS